MPESNCSSASIVPSNYNKNADENESRYHNKTNQAGAIDDNYTQCADDQYSIEN
jgi:hypothetical protein